MDILFTKYWWKNGVVEVYLKFNEEGNIKVMDITSKELVM